MQVTLFAGEAIEGDAFRGVIEIIVTFGAACGAACSGIMLSGLKPRGSSCWICWKMAALAAFAALSTFIALGTLPALPAMAALGWLFRVGAPLPGGGPLLMPHNEPGRRAKSLQQKSQVNLKLTSACIPRIVQNISLLTVIKTEPTLAQWVQSF